MSGHCPDCGNTLCNCPNVAPMQGDGRGQKEKRAELRVPVPAETVGHMPKGGTTLDFVGHAAVTDRLLTVDPFWSWEPFAVDEHGWPMVRTVGRDAVMWIRLTVCGMTRPGVGTAPADGFELHKQLVSDAIRNAAMRFGVALDLWTRDELESQVSRPEPTDAERLRAATSGWPKNGVLRRVMREQAKLHGWPAKVGGYSPDEIAAAADLAERLNRDGPEPFAKSDDDINQNPPGGVVDAPANREHGRADEQDPGGSDLSVVEPPGSVPEQPELGDV